MGLWFVVVVGRQVGGGPASLPPKYHTVIELDRHDPRGKRFNSLKHKKSPLGWKSLFAGSKGAAAAAAGGGGGGRSLAKVKLSSISSDCPPTSQSLFNSSGGNLG